MCMETEHEHGIKADAKDMKDNREAFLKGLHNQESESKRIAQISTEEAILHEHDIPVQEDDEDEEIKEGI